jgi:epoxyqueuosine reductase
MLDLITAIGFSPEYRIFVDDSPLLERAFARMSGLGWIGKNTNLLVPGSGSWVLLAEIITSLELIPDTPVKKTCGTCTKCIDICPTGAISADYQVDNDRCISYLTIENRGAIPRNLRNGVGTWIFGCDLCQEICPVNRKAKGVIFDELRIRQDLRDFDMREILSMDESAFLLRFQGTPVMRAKLKGMQRNVCVALGNIGDIEDVALLTQTLCNSAPLVRGHAAWALSQIPSPGALTSLKKRLSIEQDAWVLGELEDAVKAHTLV